MTEAILAAQALRIIWICVFTNSDTFPNVLVTAHQAFLTHEALSEIARITVENVRRFVSKQDLLEGTVL
jgi:lactate dehydrogenase-like 2-hydroxyacid dehydrogenase